MRKLIYDVETDGFLQHLTRINCLVIKDVSNPVISERETHRFRYIPHSMSGTKFNDEPWEIEPIDNIEEGLAMLADADIVIGHNIIDFDEKAVRKVYPHYAPRGRVLDTLVLVRVIFPDTKEIDGKLMARGKFPGKLMGSHSLDAWGHRLGKHKGDYFTQCKVRGIEPFNWWNPELEDYCQNDVDVNEVLWEVIQKEMPPVESVEFEHRVHELAMKMRSNGFPFDAAAALTLADELEKNRETHTIGVKERYGFWFAPEKKYLVRPVYDDPDQAARPTPFSKAQRQAAKKGETVDRSLYQDNGYLRPRAILGEDDSRAIWADVKCYKTTRRGSTGKIKDGVCKQPDITAFDPETGDGACCPIKRVDFNPGSRAQIADRFIICHGWSPADFTDSGQPEINDAILMRLADRIPEAGAFAEIFFYNKALGQVRDGKGSWLNTYERDQEEYGDGRVHCYTNTGGTVSGRCSHSGFNIGQVKSVQSAPTILKDGSHNPDLCGADGFLLPHCFKADGSIKKEAALFGRKGEYGAESRALFYTPAVIHEIAWKQIGADLKNVEARCLAAILSEFDKGELIDVLVNQGVDLHTYNQNATGIRDRALIKRVFFGLIYGAGDLKLGITADPYLTEAQQRKLGGDLRATIMRGIPALKKATEKIRGLAKNGTLIGLDGRRLRVRAQYAAFNLRLQSDAALIAKKWFILSEEALIDAGGIHDWEGDFAFLAFVHDEIQAAIKAFFAEEGAALICAAATEAGRAFNYPCPIAADAKIGQNWMETH